MFRFTLAAGTPAGVVAVAHNGLVVLTWTATPGATSYNVYRGLTSGGEGGTPYAAGVVSATYTDHGVTNGTRYYYRVAARNSYGTSGQSAEATAVPATPPTAPTGLTAVARNGAALLSWTATPGATSYTIYRALTSGGEVGTTPIITGLAATTYLNLGLTNGTRYFYRITAGNAGGNSGFSAEASTIPIAPPPTPTGLTATPSAGTVKLHWNATANATSFNVYRATTAGGEGGTTPILTNVRATYVTDSAVTVGTKYFYKIAGVDAGGTSGLSAEASATP